MPAHGLGAIPDTFDPRDHIFESARARFTVSAIPPAADWRNLCADVRDQGQQGSCTGFALRDLCEFIEKRDGTPTPLVELSPAFIYYEERKKEHTTNDCNAGARLRDGLKVLKNQGVCPEQDDPYNDQTCSAPSSQAINDASQFAITNFQRVTTLSGLKQAIAAKHGCVMGIQVYESFESPDGGHIPMPQPNEQLLGGHALFVCGYQDDPSYEGGGYLIAQNSWGTGFGDGGFIYLPYAYLTPPLTSDMWTANV